MGKRGIRGSITGVFLILFLGSLPGRSLAVSAETSAGNGEKIHVFVSILPQAYFVERIGGERVEVQVMVGPGQSPATYEPVPKQMTALSKARLYFRIGVPFEYAWLDRIQASNPDMKMVDTREGIELIPMKARDPHAQELASGQGGLKDPHIWLSLRLVKIQAQTICGALISLDPARESYYRDNLESFHGDLDRLDGEIVRLLKGLKTRKFMVFHPAWGYFARDYGLEEIPVEIQGKEPGAKDLERLITQARELGIKGVFVQEQFSQKNAEAMARAVGAEIVKVDPLARDYLTNMKKVAATFAKVMG